MKLIKSLSILLLPLFLFAVEILDFTIHTDKNKVNQGSVAIVQATLATSKQIDVQLPEFPLSERYTVIQNSTQQGRSSSSSISYVNGQIVQQSTRSEVSFYYKILFSEEGITTLPPLTVVIGGDTATTESLVYTVGQNAEEEEASLSVTYERSKSQLYLNEQLPLKVRFKMRSGTNAELTNEGFHTIIDSVLAGLDDKFSVTVTTAQPTEVEQVINGISFTVVDLDISLMAIDTGTVVIKPISFIYNERRQVRVPNTNFRTWQRVEQSARSPRLTLSVIPNPPAPAGYDGVVGRVRIRSEISDDSVTVGEGITVKYTLTGRMKSAAMGTLSLPDLPDFEQFSPERRTIADTTDGVIFTKKEVSYMLIPRSAGEFKIPLIDMVWFDPTTGEYNYERSREFTVSVTPSDKPVTPTTRYLTQESIQMYGDDIRYIKTELPGYQEVLKPYRKTVFVILLPLPWLLLIIALLFKLSSKLVPTDRERLVKKGSLGRAFKELNRIEKGKSNASPAGVIEKYLLDKYKISAPSMRRDQLRTELISCGASEEATNSILAFLDSVEVSRYSGVDSKQSLISGAKKVLKQITKEVN